MPDILTLRGMADFGRKHLDNVNTKVAKGIKN